MSREKELLRKISLAGRVLRQLMSDFLKEEELFYFFYAPDEGQVWDIPGHRSLLIPKEKWAQILRDYLAAIEDAREKLLDALRELEEVEK